MNAPQSHEPDSGRRPEGPGASLRAAREARQLSIEQVAAELHLSRALVDAIERDDYERLPEAVFVKGYLKHYARLVGLSTDHILAAYEGSGPGVEISTPVVKTSIKDEVSSGHAGVRLVTWAIALGLVALVVVWWRGYLDWAPPGGPPEPVAEQGPAEWEPAPPVQAPGGASPVDPLPERPMVSPPAEVRPPPPAPAPPEPAEGAGQTASEAPAPAPAVEAPAAVETVPEEAVPPEARSSAAGPAEPEGTAERVVFEFTGPCWVDIRDSTGRFRLFGEMTEGERRVAEGEPPWKVVLGNARAVRILVGGEVFDHLRFATGNVARFELDPADL